MRRVLWALSCALLLAGAVAAVEVRLRDGTVLEASSVRITGSYVMLELADGRRVAYDVVDVDVEALLQADDGSADAEDPSNDSVERLTSGRTLKSPQNVGGEPASGFAITDREVRHVRGSGVLGDDELAEEPEVEASGEMPEGYRQGGNVLVNRVRVISVGEDEWQISGEIVNRNRFPANNISVRLESQPGPGEEIWRSQVQVATYLEPGEKAVFEQVFSAAKPVDKNHPDVRATVIWMERERPADSGSPEDLGQAPARRVGTGPPSQPTPIQ